MSEPTQLRVDLNGYDSDYNRYYWTSSGRAPNYVLASAPEAKRAVQTYGITRLCGKVDRIVIVIPDRVQGFRENFLMHLLGPAARKLGPDELEKKLYVCVHGRDEAVSNSLHQYAMNIRSYLSEEAQKIEERAKKKAAKKPDNIVWGEPVGLFVPDIGTRLKLVLPWDFTLYAESRNHKMMEIVSGETQPKYWWGRGQRATWDVRLMPESVIIVDRVYIRQGKGFEDFSSLTFRLQKGAEISYNGGTITTKGNHRFWAKLREVNRLIVLVDLNSLPGQEKEGTARKE